MTRALLIAVGLAFWSPLAMAQMACVPLTVFEAGFKAKYGETQVFKGTVLVGGETFPARIYLNAKTGSWTLGFRPIVPPGQFCVLLAGDAFEPVLAPLNGQDL